MIAFLKIFANPWVIIVVIALMAGSAYLSWGLSHDHTIAQQRETEALIAVVKEQAELGAAEAIGKIDIKQTTIRQTVEHTVREVPVYRDCVNDPTVERLLDNARSNSMPVSSANSSELH